MPDLVVIGGGFTGLSAVLYAGRLGLETVLVDQLGGGGQLMNSGPIDSYPGVSDQPLGTDLTARLIEQALTEKVEMCFDSVTRVSASGDGFLVLCDGTEIQARAVIVATGTRPRRLGIPGEESLTGRGVSDCAICDGGFFAGKPVAVVGGGDRAAEGALHLAANGSQVQLVHPDGDLRAVDMLQRRLAETPSITIVPNTAVEEVSGAERVDGLSTRTGDEQRRLDVEAVFVNIGVEPCTETVADLVDTDPDGRIVVDLGMRTKTPGLFAAGAVRTGTGDQIATAAGDGVTAALSAAQWLRQTPSR